MLTTIQMQNIYNTNIILFLQCKILSLHLINNDCLLFISIFIVFYSSVASTIEVALGINLPGEIFFLQIYLKVSLHSEAC